MLDYLLSLLLPTRLKCLSARLLLPVKYSYCDAWAEFFLGREYQTFHLAVLSMVAYYDYETLVGLQVS